MEIFEINIENYFKFITSRLPKDTPLRINELFPGFGFCLWHSVSIFGFL